MRIDQYQGADAVGLEEKIKQHLENDPGSNEDTDIPKGYVCRLTNEIIDIPSICHYWVKVKLTVFIFCLLEILSNENFKSKLTG